MNLLDPATLLAACDGDDDGLREMCQDLQTYLPGRLADLDGALQDQDAARLREAAHKLCGLLSAFSTIAGDTAGELEELAAARQLDEARPLAAQLRTLAEELTRQVAGVTIEQLQRQAETASQAAD